MEKYTINFTKEDKIQLMRSQFLDAYLKKHLKDNPDIKDKLEEQFQELIKEIEL